jgi:tRNA1(Val) A37 N6-methylase TrmN6
MASVEPGLTEDAFHRGRFVLVQPEKGGHRAGMDALVLASAVPSGFAGMAVDFGAGAGAVGFAVALRCNLAQVTLIEVAPEMAACARRALEHPANRDLARRVTIVDADVTALPGMRKQAGQASQFADFVLMNPPYNDPRGRASPDPLRRQAHVMTAGLIDAWLRAAAGIARPKAGVAIIARPAETGKILAALDGRFGAAEIVAVHARAGAPAIRVVVRARYGSRAAISILSPLVLHEGDGGGFTTRAEAINAGDASLFGD